MLFSLPSLRSFIAANLGAQFVSPPEADMQRVLDDSTAYTPIVLLLSPGSDPGPMIALLARKKQQELNQISLGQG